jgi:hypothetical protein
MSFMPVDRATDLSNLDRDRGIGVRGEDAAYSGEGRRWIYSRRNV